MSDSPAGAHHTADYPPDPDATLPPSPRVDGVTSVTESRAGRFEIHGTIAEGGMGVVLRGRDPALDRVVAVKVLLGSLADRPDAERRFVSEAQIAGRLQHPSVVPVYELGRFTDGRPFFAMKLVEGRTLADLLAERPTPAHDLPRFLQVFEQVCQAVAYAHSHRIVHRDLKPLNVMVGAFGEVQVMDWGLAKIVGSGQCAVGREEEVPSLPTAACPLPTAHLTMAGSTLGTLAYMPPEQARGETAKLDERADVFGLGAVLCEILTGKPPYVGAPEQMYWQAFNAELAPVYARLDRCGAETELVALARACLAAEPVDRPRDAGAVAATVASYQASVQERLRQAELNRVAADARAAAERKRRRTVLALAATVLLAVSGAAAGGLWVQRDRAARAVLAANEQAEAEQRVAAAVGKAKLLAEQGRAADADVAGQRAIELAADTRVTPARRTEVESLAAAWRMEAAQTARDRALIDRLRDASDVAEDPRAPAAGNAWAFREYLLHYSAHGYRDWGMDPAKATDDVLIARLQARPAAVRRELAAGLDAWAMYARFQRRPPAEWQRLLALARAADPDADPVRQALRDVATRNHVGVEVIVASVARAFLPLAAVIQPAYGSDHRRLRDLADGLDPATVPAQTIALLAVELEGVGDADRAVDVLRAGVRAQPSEVLLHTRLGLALTNLKPPQMNEAIAHFQTARALRPRLSSRLAMMYATTGRVADAVALAREAERVRPGDGTTWSRAGLVLLESGRPAKALPFLQAAARLAPAEPFAAQFLAAALEGSGDFAAAADEMRRALTLIPTAKTGAHPDYAAALDRLRVEVERELARCSRRLALLSRLPTVLAGTDHSTPADRFELAAACALQRRFRPALTLYESALADAPPATVRPFLHRYNAACAAVLVAAGDGIDASPPDGAESASLRRKALDWLRAELVVARTWVAGPRAAAAQQSLRHWLRDGDLATVRDETRLRSLSPSERSDWTSLWAEVAALTGDSSRNP